MQEVPAFKILRDKPNKGPTKKKVYASPTLNSTKNAGQAGGISVSKDTAGNANAGGI